MREGNTQTTADTASNAFFAQAYASGTATQNLLADDTLSDAEKRGILASWASDRWAVPDRPGLNRLDDGTIVRVDDVLSALKTLDTLTIGDSPSSARTNSVASLSRQPLTMLRSVMRRHGRRPDDDDDPPPCPAGGILPLGPLPLGGCASRASADHLLTAA